jgi:hypothetical protein
MPTNQALRASSQRDPHMALLVIIQSFASMYN